MKFFDLFAGIGGFRLALERNGHECIGSCEIDKYARNIYEKNFGNKPQEADARKIKPEWLPDFDILCAGFPCQAFSLAGKRLGFEDTRGTLYHEIIRIAKEKRPKYLLLENVKGLLYHDQNKTLATILGALDEIRYDAEWQVVNSKYFVPQNRERIFIVGHSREGSGRKILPVGDFGEQLNEPCKSTQRERQRISAKVCGALDANYWKGSGSRTIVKEPKIVADRSRTLAGLGRNLESPKDISNSLTSVPKDNMLLNNHKLRKLTPLECERLQGFPDGWTEGESDSQRYKMLGNAVTVPVVQYISSLMK